MALLFCYREVGLTVNVFEHFTEHFTLDLTKHFSEHFTLVFVQVLSQVFMQGHLEEVTHTTTDSLQITRPKWVVSVAFVRGCFRHPDSLAHVVGSSLKTDVPQPPLTVGCYAGK